MAVIARLLLALVVAVAVVLPSASALAATDPFKGACAKAKDSTICQPSGGDTLTSSDGVIHRITLLIAIIAGIAAVFVMILAGIQYITSGGDPEQVSKAKKTIIFAAAGLIIIVLGQAIINVVVSRA